MNVAIFATEDFYLASRRFARDAAVLLSRLAQIHTVHVVYGSYWAVEIRNYPRVERADYYELLIVFTGGDLSREEFIDLSQFAGSNQWTLDNLIVVCDRSYCLSKRGDFHSCTQYRRDHHCTLSNGYIGEAVGCFDVEDFFDNEDEDEW